MNILEVEQLSIWDQHSGKALVHDSSFQLRKGSCLAIVGESGSGKSLTCRALTRLNPKSLAQSGKIVFKGIDLTTLSEAEIRQKRGKEIAMIMQNGMSAFDPSCVIGVHFRETLGQHLGWKRRVADDHMIKAMQRVMLQKPVELLRKYPHELSGGMLQRMMIALAIVLEPDLIIADEPTTALDTISQYEVIQQFLLLRQTIGNSMIFVSHDLGVVRQIADEVLIMRSGEIVERGTTHHIFTNAQHEYTRYLMATRATLSDHFRQLMEGS